MVTDNNVDALLCAIRACTNCSAYLAAGPRPIVQFSATARIIIIGQAPGAKVHASGVPWDDASGLRLREWLDVDAPEFYDPGKIALVPMGFCYPGTGKSGDLPPRPECAPLWHDRVMAMLPDNRLLILVGSYAQERYLPDSRKLTLTERVQNFGRYLPSAVPLPHPSWRSSGWMARNPWFNALVLPALRETVRNHLV
jgi:uracil-DNA glycosylase